MQCLPFRLVAKEKLLSVWPLGLAIKLLLLRTTVRELAVLTIYTLLALSRALSACIRFAFLFLRPPNGPTINDYRPRHTYLLPTDHDLSFPFPRPQQRHFRSSRPHRWSTLHTARFLVFGCLIIVNKLVLVCKPLSPLLSPS